MASYLVDSVLNGPFQYGTIVEPGNETTPATVRARTYTNLTYEDKIRESVDIKATNIVLQVVHQQPYQALALQQSYQALALQQSYQSPPAIHQPLQQSSSTKLDSRLVVPSFNPTYDPIANLNKLMAFVTTKFAPRFPQINNQLRTLSNPKNQATIQDGKVTVQTVQGRQTQGYANNGARNTATNQGVNRQGAAGQARVVKCYNCQEEALESITYLDPKQLALLADNGVTVTQVQASQELPSPAAFETYDLDAFDSNCDDAPSAKAVLMANLSSFDSDVLSEETLELAKESRLKIPAKQNDPSLKEKKVNIAPVDYAAINKLSEYFVKHFVPQKQLFAEHAFCLPISQPVSEKPPIPSEPVLQKEIPRELPPINNKYFEIEKKEISLDNDRLLEHIICQDVTNIMMHVDSLLVNVLPANNNCLVHDNLEIERLEQENDHLFELLLSQDIVHICVNSIATLTNYAKMEQDYINQYSENLMLKDELAKKENMVDKKNVDEVVLRC
ncbi:hypothetical protein Tco_0214938 [Tanacetum coccineum]